MFVINVVPFLTPIYLNRGEIIYYENEYADEIYFLYKGRIGFVVG